QSETRIYLTHHLYFSARYRFSPQLDAIVVVQKDWSQRVTTKRSSPFEKSFRPPQDTQKLLQGLNGAPFPQVSRLMRDLRRVIPVSLEGNDRGRAIDLLRGMTIEFHRPLRHALAAFLPGDDPARSSADPKAHAFALGVLRKVSSRMTIRPKEFAANE